MKKLLVGAHVVAWAWMIGKTTQLWWDEWGYDAWPVKYIKEHKVEVGVTTAIVAAVMWKGKRIFK